MGVIVNDTFTEASGTPNLTAHTPDTGTSWTQLLQVNAVTIVVDSTNDRITGSTNTASSGQLCKVAPDPSSSSIDVQYTIKAVDGGTATRPWGPHARISDASATNYYRIRHLPTGNASADTELMKMVGTTKTSLGTVDTGIAANDVMVFHLTDAAKSLDKNGAQILTSSDNTIAGPGSVGWSVGQVKGGDTGNCSSVWAADDFSVTEAGATQYSQSVAGTLTSSGALVNQTQKVLAGSLSSGGALTNQTQKPLAGTMTSSGALVKQTQKVLAGALSSVGALVNQAQKVLAGAMSSVGALVKQTRTSASGTLTSSGVMAATKVALVSIGGTLTSSGTLIKQTGKSLAGALAPSGTITKRVSTSLSGVLTSVGTLAKQTAKSFSGALSSAGSLTTVYTPGSGPVIAAGIFRGVVSFISKPIASVLAVVRPASALSGIIAGTVRPNSVPVGVVSFPSRPIGVVDVH